MKIRASRHGDLTGRRFGRLVAIKDSGQTTRFHSHIWECLCDCGNTKLVNRNCLTDGDTQSCGCWLRENGVKTGRAGAGKPRTAKHGHSRMHGGVNLRSRTYSAWSSMKHRCYNKNNVKFSIYGGKGISVCKAWRDDFRTFLSEMGECPEGLTLDRIDSRFGYFYGNCRWATYAEQNSHLRARIGFKKIYDVFPKLRALLDSREIH